MHTHYAHPHTHVQAASQERKNLLTQPVVKAAHLHLFDYISCTNAIDPNMPELVCARGLPGDFVKMHILIQQFWEGPELSPALRKCDVWSRDCIFSSKILNCAQSEKKFEICQESYFHAFVKKKKGSYPVS